MIESIAIITVVACSAPVEFQYLPRHLGGHYTDGVIYLNRDKEKINGYVHIHECGHHLLESNNIKLPRYFGKSPFITEYAKEAAHEDFAEVYAQIKKHKARSWKLARTDRGHARKLRFVLRQINKFERTTSG